MYYFNCKSETINVYRVKATVKPLLRCHLWGKAKHFVIKFVSDLRQGGGFPQVLLFPPLIKTWPPPYNFYIVESGAKHHTPPPSSPFRQRKRRSIKRQITSYEEVQLIWHFLWYDKKKMTFLSRLLLNRGDRIERIDWTYR